MRRPRREPGATRRRRSVPHRRSILRVAVVIAALAWLGAAVTPAARELSVVGSASAADPSPLPVSPDRPSVPGSPALAGPLNGPATDVVPFPDGDGPPRLLVARPGDGGTSARLEVLRDVSGSWEVAASAPLPAPMDGPSTVPWLIPLPGTSRVVVAAAGPSGVHLAPVTVGDATIDGRRGIVVPGVLDGLVGVGADARAAGAGGPAIVATLHAPGDCATRIAVFGGADLALRSEVTPGPFRLGPALVTDLDGRPGAELAARVVERCSVTGRVDPALDRVKPGTLVVLDPTDGRMVAAVDLFDTDQPMPPLAVRVEPGPVPVLLASSGDSTVAIDPAHGWAVRDLADSPSRPLAVGPPGPDGTMLVLLERGVQASLARLRRDAAGLPVLGPELDRRTGEELQAWRLSQRDGPDGAPWPQGWVGDVDGDGCPDLVAPTIVLSCAERSDERSRIGPPWVATRPIALIPGGIPRLLVASGLQAPTDVSAGLPAPTPAPVADGWGGWRTGPSIPFALAQLAARDLLYAPTFAPPDPTVDPATGREPLEATVAGRAGDRAVARVAALDPGSDAGSGMGLAVRPPSLGTLLRPGPGTELVRAAVRVGVLSGVEVRAVHLPLPSADLADGVRTWRIDVVTLNDWGQISTPTSGVVRLDVVGPNLVADPPFVSLLWPLTASLTGRTESGATVELVGGPTVTASRAGIFRIPLTLAPWPQDVELRATDAEGNPTTLRLSIVGGLDVRRLPWQAVLVAVLIAAIVGTALRDAGRALRRQGPALAAARGRLAPEGVSLRGGREERLAPTIEDLPARPVGLGSPDEQPVHGEMPGRWWRPGRRDQGT